METIGVHSVENKYPKKEILRANLLPNIFIASIVVKTLKNKYSRMLRHIQNINKTTFFSINFGKIEFWIMCNGSSHPFLAHAC